MTTGKWVVLYFYPKDFTSGCTLEAQNFQRTSPNIRTPVLSSSASAWTMPSRTSICAKEGLNFKPLADTDTKVSEAYGSLKDYDGKKMSARNTFIINPEGKIAKVFTGVNRRPTARKCPNSG